MKKAIIAVIICVLLLVACFSPWRDGDLGTFTVIAGSGQNGRTIWDDDEKGNHEDLIYEISVSGPGIVQAEPERCDVPKTFTVTPGSYKVFVFAYLEEVGGEETAPEQILQAVGSQTVTVRPGKNNNVTVKMKEPDGDGYFKVTFELEEGDKTSKIYRYVPAGETVSAPKQFREKNQTLEPGLYEDTFYDDKIYFDDVYGKWERKDTHEPFAFVKGVSKESINENITLKGEWGKLPERVNSFTDNSDTILRSALVHAKENPPYEFTLLLDKDIIITSNNNITNDPVDYPVTLTLIGKGERTINIGNSEDCYMFKIEQNINLTLGKNITIKGHTGNTNALVVINGGTLTMLDGSVITGNTNTTSNVDGMEGGGVYVGGGGTFNMYDGTISDNNAPYKVFDDQGTYIYKGYGGGVYVKDGGTFNMYSGTISNNSAGGGGGVYVRGDRANFTMSNGVISGNWSSSYGGGVYVRRDTNSPDVNPFIKTGGIIYGYTGDVNQDLPSSTENKAWYSTSSQLSSPFGHAVYEEYGNAGPPTHYRSSDETLYGNWPP